MFDFRDEVKDVTGFEGMVTGRCEYMGQPNQFLVERMDEKGRIQSHWLNEDRLTLTSNTQTE